MNIFTILAEYRSRNGDDMEHVARDLAKALRAVCEEGVGTDKLNAELIRLLQIKVKE